MFWIDASTSDSIRRGFLQLSPLLQVDHDIDSVKRALANTSQPWLLIFDNADNPRLPLAPWFPSGDRGDVIVTSRNPDAGQYSTVGVKVVTQMLSEDALELLNKTAFGTAIKQGDDHACNDKVGLQVVQTLGCLALAIVQAGAYIREISCSFQDYLELYRRRRDEVLAYVPKHVGTDYRYTVYTTWQVSLDQLESSHDEASQHALTILRLLCFYHHEQVPMQMFYQAWQNSQGEINKLDGLLWLGAESSFLDYRQAVQTAVALLASFSLVTRDAEMSLSMHPLMHEWCRDKVAEGNKQASCQRAMSFMTRSIA